VAAAIDDGTLAEQGWTVRAVDLDRNGAKVS